MYDNWEDLEQACLVCRQCGLCQERRHVVFGVGNPKAKVLFVGEGPGEHEDLQGEPFVGRVAAMRMMKPDIKITKEHGIFLEKNGTLMMATLHPAALLRNPKQKPAAFEDYLRLREKIDELGCDVAK